MDEHEETEGNSTKMPMITRREKYKSNCIYKVEWKGFDNRLGMGLKGEVSDISQKSLTWVPRQNN